MNYAKYCDEEYITRRRVVSILVKDLRKIATDKDLAFYSDGDDNMKELRVCFVKDHEDCLDMAFEIDDLKSMIASEVLSSVAGDIEYWLHKLRMNSLAKTVPAPKGPYDGLFVTMPRNAGRSAMLEAINSMRYAHERITSKYNNKKINHPEIEKVIFNDPATIVLWKDGTKTVVKAVDEPFDKEKGLTMAIAKKVYGNEGNYYNEIKKWTR